MNNLNKFALAGVAVASVLAYWSGGALGQSFEEWDRRLRRDPALSAAPGSSRAAQKSASLVGSLPAEVQKDIEDIRARCRVHLVNADETRVSSGDDGLEVFTVSGVQAVMIDERELCDGEGALDRSD